jgi:hypothetical protein
MSVLCSRSSARVEGDVLFNGRPMTKAVKRSLGFVTQDDLLFAEVRRVRMRVCVRSHGFRTTGFEAGRCKMHLFMDSS